MKSGTILLSGATGFLGSHLAKDLTSGNYRVIALIRDSSDLSRCNKFKNDNLIFVNTDSKDHFESIQKYEPSVFIHSAWNGVAAKGRGDWNVQVGNIALTTRLLVLANELKIKKIISFGSQAEYGNFSGRIDEGAPCNPMSAYGAAKLATLDVVRSFCEVHSLNWFWFRLFSIYGEGENREWLIPSVIHNTRNNIPMDLTGCEQRYDYLYTKEFTRAVTCALGNQSESGIFNLSSNTSMPLKEVIDKIRNLVNKKAVLNFGALPYRPNQVMHMEGNSEKFNSRFNFSPRTDFDSNIKEVVNSYLSGHNV